MFPLRRLDAIVTIKGGKRLPAGHDLVVEETNHPYIRARDIGEGRVRFDEPVYLKDQSAEILRRYVVEKDDVCVTIVGANVGDVGMVPSSLHKANLTENAAKLKSIDGMIDQQYLKFALLTWGVQSQFKTIAGGAAQPKLALYKIGETEIPYPPLPIQKKIAAILSAYDDLIENNEKRIKVLEEMAQNLYREWFVNFRFPGHQKVKMVDSTLGKIPAGWDVKRMEEVAHITIGKTPPRKQSEWFSNSTDDVKWASISDMNAGIFITDTKERVTRIAADKFNIVRVPDNTVLMSFKLTVGRLAITVGEMATNEAIAHFAINDDTSIIPEYVYLHLDKFKFATLGNTSSIGTAINSKIVKQIQILMPDKNTMAYFSGNVTPMFSEIRSLILRNHNLRQTRDMLLPKLISGEVDVSDLDIPIPGDAG